MAERVTKRDNFTRMYNLMVEAGETELAEFCEKEIESLDRKAEKAKERAAEKRAEADEFQAIVAGALTEELQSGPQIWELVGDEDEDGLSLGKVRARLTKLVKAGAAEKEEMTVETDGKSRKVMGYRLP